MENSGQDSHRHIENQNSIENDDAKLFLVPFEYNSPCVSQSQRDQKNNSEDDLESNQYESSDNKIDLALLLAKKELKKKKRIQKKIKKENIQVSKRIFVIQNSLSKELFKLNCGVFITQDGVLRYYYCLTPISFGFYPTRIVKIEERHNLAIVDINHQIDKLVPFISIEECVDLMMNKNILKLSKQEIYNQLENFDKIIQQIYQFEKINEQMTSFKEKEFQEFVKWAFDYIDQIQQNENNKFFIFNIGRYNYINQEFELAHIGFSKSYLSFLGLDCDSFKALILRNQKIDLIQEKSDVVIQALKGINLFIQFNEQDNYTANINTFDGFPIEVCYQVRNLHLTEKLNNYQGKGYILSLTHATLSPQYMQGLIDYRQKLMLRNKKISIEEIIRKE